jgi:hypothetical protein
MKIPFLVFMILTTPAMVATTITKQDIIATVEHQRRITHQAQDEAALAKKELAVVQSAIDAQAGELNKAKKDLAVVTSSRNYWKKVAERLLFALSLTAGILAGLVFFQFSTAIITSIYPPALPFSILISIGVGVATFAATWATLVRV